MGPLSEHLATPPDQLDTILPKCLGEGLEDVGDEGLEMALLEFSLQEEASLLGAELSLPA